MTEKQYTKAEAYEFIIMNPRKKLYCRNVGNKAWASYTFWNKLFLRSWPGWSCVEGVDGILHDGPFYETPEPPKEEPEWARHDPAPEMLKNPLFEAVWQCIKSWDINVPGAYIGYCGATGNHVRAILDAIAKVEPVKPEPDYELPECLKAPALAELRNRLIIPRSHDDEEFARCILIQARKDASKLVAEAMLAKGAA